MPLVEEEGKCDWERGESESTDDQDEEATRFEREETLRLMSGEG